MTCRDFERFWIARSSDELPPAVQAHLAGCAGCTTLVQGDTATNAFLRRVRTARSPVDVDLAWSAIERELEERSRQTSGIDWHRPLTLAVTGLACAAFAGVLLLGYTSATKNSGSKTVSSSTGGRGGETGDPSATVLAPDPRSLSRSLVGRHDADADTTAPPAPARAAGRQTPRRRVPRPQSPIADDLVYVNRAPEAALRQRLTLPQDDRNRTEAHVRRNVPVRDDFVQIPFPRIADVNGSQMAAAVEGYQREAAIVDPRLSHEVTCAFKATALADLCERLRADTGIQLGAGASVADEKVTLFCEKLPLRDVMRQLSRPFGYAWLRSGKKGEYKYELVQDLRSQLLEEELRNRNRNEALLALDREIQRYRPYLDLLPEEALRRSKTAPPGEKRLLENLARYGWGPIQMYFRLSRADLTAIHAGQRLVFSAEPKPGERSLPPDVARGVLQSLRNWRVQRKVDGFSIYASDEVETPDGVPPAEIPEVRTAVELSINESELGQFTLNGGPYAFIPNGFRAGGRSGPWAGGTSSGLLKPDGNPVNASVARDPGLRVRVTLRPQPSCRLSPISKNPGRVTPEPRLTSADVLEALHKVTGLPIIADYYTRLYPPSAVSAREMTLSEALKHLAEGLRLRWNRDNHGDWLQFRSSTYYNDRLKEVPNRLLTRWSASRRQHGALTLDDLIEIAQLPDAQLDAVSMGEGARACFGLEEWHLASHPWLRLHLRYLAALTPTQRREVQSPTGLAFTRMSFAQQQGFIQMALGGEGERLQSLDELDGAMMRVDYTLPGWFQRVVPGDNWPQWVVLLAPGPEGKRAPRPPVRQQSREATLQAARQINPDVQETEIVPTELDLIFFYMPGSSNRRDIHLVGYDTSIHWTTQKPK